MFNGWKVTHMGLHKRVCHFNDLKGGKNSEKV